MLERRLLANFSQQMADGEYRNLRSLATGARIGRYTDTKIHSVVWLLLVHVTINLLAFRSHDTYSSVLLVRGLHIPLLDGYESWLT